MKLTTDEVETLATMLPDDMFNLFLNDTSYDFFDEYLKRGFRMIEGYLDVA